MTDELDAYIVEQVEVLLDQLSGDVGLWIDSAEVLVLSREQAAELAADLREVTRPRTHCTTSPAKWRKR